PAPHGQECPCHGTVARSCSRSLALRKAQLKTSSFTSSGLPFSSLNHSFQEGLVCRRPEHCSLLPGGGSTPSTTSRCRTEASRALRGAGRSRPDRTAV